MVIRWKRAIYTASHGIVFKDIHRTDGCDSTNHGIRTSYVKFTRATVFPRASLEVLTRATRLFFGGYIL
jgi:hypothetical protein